MSTTPELIKANFRSLMQTKYKLEDEVYTLHNNKIYKCVIEAITKTEISKDCKYTKEQETYTLRIEGGRLTRTNNAGEIFETVEEVLNNIKII
tara:strand:- start:586 stop:864 length:279 start_codon:yes stop_codon:yes gene_type:complete